MKATTSASCSIEPDSRRSLSRGFLSPVRCSDPRESCERATTGTPSSLARALRPREMLLTSWVRFSNCFFELPDEAVERGDELALVFAGDEAGLEFAAANHGFAGEHAAEE